MRRAASCAIAVGVVLACTLRAPRIDSSARTCSIDAQCNGDLCYAGLCRSHANQLASIYAEVRAADPALGVLQQAGIDPRQSPIVEFQLVAPLPVAGHVFQQPEPLPGAGATPVPDASVVLTDADAGIPGRAASLSIATDTFGAFSATVPVSSWNVAVRPPAAPPLLDAGIFSTSVSDFRVLLPPKSSIASVSGAIVSGDAGVVGLQVSATTPQGDLLGAPDETLSDGSFHLSLPPGSQTWSLQIGPKDPSATIPVFNPRIVTRDTPTMFDIGPLPPPASLSGRAVDANGAPIPNAFVQALSTDVSGWTMSRQTKVDPSGAFTLLLVAGNYVVEAVPGADPAQPALSGEIPIALDAGVGGTNMGLLRCPPKAHAQGSVLQPDGRAAGPGYQVVALRLPDRVVTGRTGTASATKADGSFELTGDPGLYRLSVLPPPETGLPLTYAVVALSGTGDVVTLPPITIAPPVEVVGTVFGEGKSPIEAATVEFYAIDSTHQRAVLIGSALSDSTGRYRVVLPDVPNPAGP
jgi:Carboxypeptidase regulatory-like domain